MEARLNGLQVMAVLQMQSHMCACVCVCLNPTEVKMSPCVLIEGLVGALFKLSNGHLFLLLRFNT